MTKILYLGTHGTDDPTRASLPFHMALGAVEGGHAAEINLAGDAVFVFRTGSLRASKESGSPP